MAEIPQKIQDMLQTLLVRTVAKERDVRVIFVMFICIRQ